MEELLQILNKLEKNTNIIVEENIYQKYVNMKL